MGKETRTAFSVPGRLPGLARRLGPSAERVAVRGPDPAANQRAGLAAGMAVLSLASVPLIGQIGVLLFIVMTAATLALRPGPSASAFLRFWPLLLLPVLAILSTIWSDAPQRTMRAGLQLFLTIAATIVVCRNLRADRLILALFVAFMITALTVLPVLPFAITRSEALVAWWGSKNQVGYVGYTLFALSMAMIVDKRQSIAVRLIALGAAPYALIVAYAAQSGGTVTSVALFMAVFPPLALLGAVRMPVRLTLILFALALVCVAALFLNDIQAAIVDFRTNTLGKDATLTGRTYLWQFAERLAASHPGLGTGYYAFWRQGNIDAEGLWRWGGIASRAGFNFHNAFVEMRVDLGITGVVLLAGTCVIVLAVAVVRQVARPDVALAALISFTVVSYFRSYVEDGLIAPFSMVTLMWLATLIYGYPARQKAPDSAKTVPAGGRDPRVSRTRRQMPGAAIQGG